MSAKHVPSPLDFDPFEGDFGSPGDKTLSDAMVVARKPHACSHCNGGILAKDTYRSRADVVDGDLMRWKWCALCCTAMVSQMLFLEDDEADGPEYPFDLRAGHQVNSTEMTEGAIKGSATDGEAL